MTYIVSQACLGHKDKSCVEVCPVDCFYDIKKIALNDKYGIKPEDDDDDEAVGMLMIHPDECINCGACETECPFEAIFEDSAVPEGEEEFIALNEEETTKLTDQQLDELRILSK